MRKAVLLVDDDRFFQAAMADGLRAAAYEVAVAGDGLEALARVHAAPPDAILLDLNMPKLDGFQTCRLLKRNPQTRQIPVIILTGPALEDRKVLQDLGAEALVRKAQAGVTLAEVLRTIRRLESTPGEARPPRGTAAG